MSAYRLVVTTRRWNRFILPISFAFLLFSSSWFDFLGFDLTLLTFFPFYARLKHQRVEDNETRYRILRLISSEPGLNLSNIVAKLDIGWGTAAYHTQILLRQNRVQDLRVLNRVCFFAPAQSSPGEQLQTILLRQPNYEEVMRVVARVPGASQREIAAQTGHARQYISRLVGKLQRAGLVRAQPGPVGRQYYPTVREPSQDPAVAPAHLESDPAGLTQSGIPSSMAIR